MRRLDFNNVALLTIADICTGMQPSVRIPLHPSLLTSSGSVQDPAFMESAALMSRFGDYPNYEVWRNKRNGASDAGFAGRAAHRRACVQRSPLAPGPAPLPPSRPGCSCLRSSPAGPAPEAMAGCPDEQTAPPGPALPQGTRARRQRAPASWSSTRRWVRRWCRRPRSSSCRRAAPRTRRGSAPWRAWAVRLRVLMRLHKGGAQRLGS